MNSTKTEARTSTKFMVKYRERNNEMTGVLLKVYEDNATKKSAVYKWKTHFKNG